MGSSDWDEMLDGMVAEIDAAMTPEQRTERDIAAAERAAEEAERVDLDRRRRISKSLEGGQFPARLVGAALALLDGEIRDTPAMVRVRQFCDADIAAGRTLLVLSGGVGSGKSTSATLAMVLRRTDRPLFLRAATIEAAGRYDRDLRSKWEHASAMVVDDLGAEYADGKGNFLSELDEMLDWYYADRRPLVITTNLDASGFHARYGGKEGRIVSRIREAGAWANCGGVDLRRPS